MCVIGQECRMNCCIVKSTIQKKKTSINLFSKKDLRHKTN